MLSGLCRLVIVGIMCGVVLLPASLANGVRKIVHADGLIEFTNITKKDQGVVLSRDPASSVSQIYKYENVDGVLAYTDQAPLDIVYEILKVTCYACDPHSTINWQQTPLNTTAYQYDILQYAQLNQVEPALVRAVIHAESGFNPVAVSSQGAQGLMQLMPATATELGVTDPLDPKQNIAGGVKYLAKLLTRFNGDIELAAAAYNAGPGAVTKYNGIPPYSETISYVKRVGVLHQRYQQAL